MMPSSERVSLDLHMHSCYSIDGEYTCAQLAEQGKQQGDVYKRQSLLCESEK